jgi:hypothetical protein
MRRLQETLQIVAGIYSKSNKQHDSYRTIFQAQDKAKVVSRISINEARTFEQATRDHAFCC